MKTKKKICWENVLVAVLIMICTLWFIAALLVSTSPKKSEPEKGYSMTVAHSGTPGDASYSVTLYGPDGEPVLRLDAYHVAGTFEEPGYSYGFTWLDDVELKISEVWGQ